MRNSNNRIKKFCVLILITLLQNSCGHTPQEDYSDLKLIQCISPKPQICTREYRPVCGFEEDGNHQSYSNACTACASPDVISYYEGDCNKVKSLSK